MIRNNGMDRLIKDHRSGTGMKYIKYVAMILNVILGNFSFALAQSNFEGSAAERKSSCSSNVQDPQKLTRASVTSGACNPKAGREWRVSDTMFRMSNLRPPIY